MHAYEARKIMQETRLRNVRGAPLMKAIALIEKSAKEGAPGVNFMFPSRPGGEDPLVGLSLPEEEMLAAELQSLGYKVIREELKGDDPRDTRSFSVTWNEAQPQVVKASTDGTQCRCGETDDI